MKLIVTAALAGLVACSHAPAQDAKATSAPQEAKAAPQDSKAAPAARAAPGGGALTATDGKPVEIASLYQGHCAVITFYRGFF
jgi:hypothetical protein